MIEKRISVCMLTLCLVLGFLPGTALAEDITAQSPLCTEGELTFASTLPGSS